jgi:hypothetical protein
MSDKINLFITMTDGSIQKLTISPTKPIGLVYEELSYMVDRPVFSLMKEGKEIQKQGVMIKYVPLKNGDTLTEGIGEKNMSMLAKQNAILRKKVREGIVPIEDIVEVKIYPLWEDPIFVMVKNTATVDTLKDVISGLINRPIEELILDRGGEIYLGWVGEMTNNTSRVYNGSQTLESLGVRGNTMILREAHRPITRKEIEAEKKALERKKAAEDLHRRREEARYQAYKQQEREAEEAMFEAYKQQQREEEARKRAHRQYEEDMRKEAERRKRASEKAVPSVTPHEICKLFLEKEGIVDRKTYLAWMLINHSDKTTAHTPEDEEKVKRVNACVDLLKIKNIRGGRKTRKGKKQSHRRHSRKN